jgi:hypothetical protein
MGVMTVVLLANLNRIKEMWKSDKEDKYSLYSEVIGNKHL